MSDEFGSKRLLIRRHMDEKVGYMLMREDSFLSKHQPFSCFGEVHSLKLGRISISNTLVCSNQTLEVGKTDETGGCERMVREIGDVLYIGDGRYFHHRRLGCINTMVLGCGYCKCCEVIPVKLFLLLVFFTNLPSCLPCMCVAVKWVCCWGPDP